MEVFGIIVLIVVVTVGMIVWLLRVGRAIDERDYRIEKEDAPLAGTSSPSRSTHTSRPANYEFMSGLPTIYYCLAILCGLGLLFVTLVNAKDLSGAEIGGLIGYTAGAVLSMFAVGRAIELLEDIRDAVRNTPALSPGRSDDE